MATELERLVVSLEAQVSKFEMNLAKARGQTDASLKQIEQRFAQSERQIETSLAGLSARMGAGLQGAMARVGAAIAAGFSVEQIKAAIDAYAGMQNALRIAGLEGDQLAGVFDRLFQIAQQNGAALAPLVSLYARLSQSQTELHASSGELIRFTEGVSVALKVAGTDAQTASGALTQLGQALGGGVVRAEEFNSVNEQAQPILKAVAAGLKEAGGSVATLRTLVTDGQVSSEAFFRAFLSGMPTLQEQADKALPTIAQGMTRVANAFAVAVGEFDKVSGASTSIAAGLERIAAGIGSVGDKADAVYAKIKPLIDAINFIGKYSPTGLLAQYATDSGVFAPTPKDGLTRTTRTSMPTGTIPGSAAILSGGGFLGGKSQVSIADFPAAGAKGGKSASAARISELEQEIQSIQRHTQTLQIQAGQFGLLEKEAARYAATQQLLNAATADGKPLTDQQRAQIAAVADAYATATARMEDLRARTEAIQDAAQGMAGAVAGAFDELIVQGDSLNEVFQRLLRTLQSDILRSLLTGQGSFGGLFGTSGQNGQAGGLLGSLFAGLFLPKASGGYVSGPGSGTSDSILARLSNGEFVVNAQSTARFRGLLEAINSQAQQAFPALANGGFVSAFPGADIGAELVFQRVGRVI